MKKIQWKLEIQNGNVIIGLRNGLVPQRQQAVFWTSYDPVYW